MVVPAGIGVATGRHRLRAWWHRRRGGTPDELAQRDWDRSASALREMGKDPVDVLGDRPGTAADLVHAP